MCIISATVGDPLMDTRQRLLPPPVFVPLVGLFSSILELLYPLQVGFIAAVEARVLNFLALGCGQKRLHSHIHTDNMGRQRRLLTLDLTRERCVPFARTSAAQRNGLDRTLNRAVQDDIHRADVRQDEAITVEPHALPVLGMGDAVIATNALEAGVAHILRTLLHATEERLKRQIDPHLDILQHLRIHPLKRRALGLPAWKHCLGVIQTTLNTVFVSILAGFKGLVVHPPTFVQHRLQDTPLTIRDVDAVFVRRAHAVRYSTRLGNEQVCAIMG